jgi:DNA-binding GntR family transcriptional regulator
MTRAEMLQALNRASSEGSMERLPGYGWAFLPVLTSMTACRDSHRFRQTIEPAALLEPGFVLNRDALQRRLKQQQALAAGLIRTATETEIFEMNNDLHETIIECSQNSFFIESFRRLKRLRQLAEYRQKLDRASAAACCREHIAIVRQLLSDRRKRAAALLAKHLGSIRKAKSHSRER